MPSREYLLVVSGANEVYEGRVIAGVQLEPEYIVIDSIGLPIL